MVMDERHYYHICFTEGAQNTSANIFVTQHNRKKFRDHKSDKSLRPRPFISGKTLRFENSAFCMENGLIQQLRYWVLLIAQISIDSTLNTSPIHLLPSIIQDSQVK